jgi:dipeptidyl aminopeptidase/acylaminoacyl peptidase
MASQQHPLLRARAAGHVHNRECYRLGQYVREGIVISWRLVISRPLVMTALLVLAAISNVSISAGARRTPGTTRACASADCVPDILNVSVHSRRSQLILSKLGGRGGSFKDMSPDRKSIVVNQALRLSTATISGHVIRRLADGDIATARWSPNGKMIAFSVFAAGHPCGSSLELWVVQASGGGLRKLSDCANYPAWAPDSKQLAFIGNVASDGSGTLSIADIDGTSRKDLVNWSGTSAPKLAWAPRGNRIAFTAGSGGGEVEIIHSDGTGSLVKIPHATSPSWRQDGQRLAIVRIQRPFDRFALEIVSPDFSSVRRIDRGKAIVLPAWSRDGRLAYLKEPIVPRGVGGGAGIYEARPGTTPRRLTNEPSDASYFGIFWSVRGDRVLYLRCQT